jgi:hypothetical protein
MHIIMQFQYFVLAILPRMWIDHIRSHKILRNANTKSQLDPYTSQIVLDPSHMIRGNMPKSRVISPIHAKYTLVFMIGLMKEL